MNEIIFGHEITFEEFNGLRDSVGWPLLSRRQFDLTIANGRYICAARDGEKAIGMVRAVGDGGYNLLVTDVIVSEAYRKNGIATKMMEMLLGYVKENTLEGETTMVNLMSAKGRETFYQRLGFIERPNEKLGAGMCMYIKTDDKTKGE